MPSPNILARSPFKLLSSYGQKDVQKFFGRGREIRLIYDYLMRSKFMLIYGASGTGKTSLVQCGLHGMYSPRDWLPIIVRRKDDLLKSIWEELQDQYNQRFQTYKEQNLAWYPELPAPEPESFSSLRDLIKGLFNLCYVPIYLILDQFEEIFTLGDRTEQDNFFQALKELDLFSEDLFCKILIVTREEYIAHFYRYEERLPFLFENRFRVEMMREERLLNVVEGTLGYPYKGFSEIKLEPGTSKQILANLTDKRGEVDLSTLQVFLDRLYREDLAKAKGREYIYFNLDLVGKNKLTNVLSKFLDDQAVRISDQLKNKFEVQEELSRTQIPMQILFQLVTDQGTKQNLSIDQVISSLNLGKTPTSESIVKMCLEEFSSPESRILNRLKFAKTSEDRFEVVHDRLAEQIHRKFSAEEVYRREALVTISNKQKRYNEAIKPKAKRQEFLSKGEIELTEKSLNTQELSFSLKNFLKNSIKYHKKKESRRSWINVGLFAASFTFGILSLLAYTYFVDAKNNFRKSQKNLLQFKISQYEDVVEKASSFRALGAPDNAALKEYQYANNLQAEIEFNFRDMILSKDKPVRDTLCAIFEKYRVDFWIDELEKNEINVNTK